MVGSGHRRGGRRGQHHPLQGVVGLGTASPSEQTSQAQQLEVHRSTMVPVEDEPVSLLASGERACSMDGWQPPASDRGRSLIAQLHVQSPLLLVDDAVGAFLSSLNSEQLSLLRVAQQRRPSSQPVATQLFGHAAKTQPPVRAHRSGLYSLTLTHLPAHEDVCTIMSAMAIFGPVESVHIKACNSRRRRRLNVAVVVLTHHEGARVAITQGHFYVDEAGVFRCFLLPASAVMSMAETESESPGTSRSTADAALIGQAAHAEASTAPTEVAQEEEGAWQHGPDPHMNARSDERQAVASIQQQRMPWLEADGEAGLEEELGAGAQLEGGGLEGELLAVCMQLEGRGRRGAPQLSPPPTRPHSQSPTHFRLPSRGNGKPAVEPTGGARAQSASSCSASLDPSPSSSDLPSSASSEMSERGEREGGEECELLLVQQGQDLAPPAVSGADSLKAIQRLQPCEEGSCVLVDGDLPLVCFRADGQMVRLLLSDELTNTSFHRRLAAVVPG
jgi:hypothetical protein